MLLNLFKSKKQEENTLENEINSFFQDEKERRQKAESFVRMMLGLIPYAAQEVWGYKEDRMIIGDTVLFEMSSQHFFVKSTDGVELAVLDLRGQPFWQSVQEIMNFAHDLLEDIQQREVGRNQLISSMDQLTQRIKDSSIAANHKKGLAIAQQVPQFAKNN